MSEIKVGENETLESALRRFKRKCAESWGSFRSKKERTLRKAKRKEKEKIRSCKKEKIQVVFNF